MGRTPTIRDVALRAGVSVATASNVVNGVRPVGEASRVKVLEAIAALDYRLDRAASALRGRSTRLIGMVVPDITNVFFASLVHGVETLAERDGYDLLIVSTSEAGGYDTLARAIARHIGTHIAGHPTVIVRNMPGAGGLTATNYLYAVAERRFGDRHAKGSEGHGSGIKDQGPRAK